MNLIDYVIDTKGVLTPAEIMANHKVYDMHNKEIVRLDHYDSLATFRCIDMESRLFKFRDGFIRPKNKQHVVAVRHLHIYDKMVSLLYE